MKITSRCVAVLAVLLCFPSWASHWGQPPVPQDDREFFVDESKLPFDSLPGTDTETSWGVLKGAGYLIEVPADWNGDLVMYTHGFRGTGEELTVDAPPLPMRAYLVANGFAWAASSYTKNYYDVVAGVESTNELVRYFRRNIAKPDRTFMTGFSMGGHVIGAAVEQYPNVACPEGRRGRLCRRIANLLGRLSGGVKYDGAVPFCGVMGDLDLFNYFADFAFGAETNAGIMSQFPPPDDYFTSVFPFVIGGLFTDFPNGLTAAGQQHKELTRVLSGGDRPGFDAAYPFWSENLLFGLFGDSTLDVDGILSGPFYDNIGKIYQFDADPALTAAEQAFNDNIIRMAKPRSVNRERFLKLERVPIIEGRLAVPVVSVHTLGDLFVPFSMQQIYAREAQQRHRSRYLVSRATRAIGHCEFSGEELVGSFASMVDWVDTGVRPAGDAVLDPDAVANPAFGCEFSDGAVFSRGAFPACP